MADKKVELHREEVRLLIKLVHDHLGEQVRIISKFKGSENIRTINDLKKVDGNFESFQIPLWNKLQELEYQVPNLD
tara:strand:- start:504 stop:731 length:228 start_codon:yes stop_codon:yes gene_type:complete